ncbi:MAG: hypothetical protein G01um101430_377 [Parcubacteria group bacterium Gr01-1014_30]|nr:MAG: hypothetical protein G01um101430_377 [Parcubacteria group bacterium Gr01-1014_30]
MQALKEPKYLALAVVFAVLVMSLYAFLQVLPQGVNNFWFWFTLLTPLAWLLYVVYGILFGVTLSFFIWQRVKKNYPSSKAVKGGLLGALGGVLGTTAPVCSACLPWAVLLLPASLAFPFVQYNSLIMTFSIGLLILALWLLGGFTPTPNEDIRT